MLSLKEGLMSLLVLLFSIEGISLSNDSTCMSFVIIKFGIIFMEYSCQDNIILLNLCVLFWEGHRISQWRLQRHQKYILDDKYCTRQVKTDNVCKAYRECLFMMKVRKDTDNGTRYVFSLKSFDENKQVYYSHLLFN